MLVSFGPPERTRRVIAEVQKGGVLWCGGTVWQGHTAMRISVSSWATTAEDVERSLTAFARRWPGRRKRTIHRGSATRGRTAQDG